MRKKLISLLLAATMAFSLTACGGGSKEEATSSTTNTTTADTAISQDDAESSVT